MISLGRELVQSLAYPGETRDVERAEVGGIADRLAAMRTLVEGPGGYGNFLVHEKAVEIVRRAGAPDRNAPAQMAAILEAVQGRHQGAHMGHSAGVYYVREGEETFQSPLYTLKHSAGDCDDFSILISGLCESIGIPTRFEVLGWDGDWQHVYSAAGLPSSKPVLWIPLEGTMPGAKLGFSPKKFVEQNLARARALL